MLRINESAKKIFDTMRLFHMKFFLLVLTRLFISAGLLGQDITTIKRYSFRKYDCYAFSKEHKHQFVFDIKDKTDYFTPDSLDVFRAESGISAHKDNLHWRKGMRNGISNYDRQYLGYYRQDGTRILIVNFINTDNGKKGRELKESIDKELIIGFGDWYEKNTFRLVFNLTTSEVGVY